MNIGISLKLPYPRFLGIDDTKNKCPICRAEIEFPSNNCASHGVW